MPAPSANNQNTLRMLEAEAGHLCLYSDRVVRVEEIIDDNYCWVVVPTIFGAQRERAYRSALIVIATDAEEIKGLTLPTRRDELIEYLNDPINQYDYGSDYLLLLYFKNILIGEDRTDLIPRWFSDSIACAADDSRQLSWAPEPPYMMSDTRRRRGTPKVLLAAMNRLFGDEEQPIFSKEQIKRLTYLFGEILPGRDMFTFEVVEGDDLMACYQRGPNSCMRNTSYPRLYADNPETCKMVKIFRKGEYFGRALLWTTNEGKTVMDRIYPGGGIHVRFAQRWAEAQGWDYLENQAAGQSTFASGASYTVTLNHCLKNDQPVGWPYMDTFAFSRSADYGDTMVLNQRIGGNWHFQFQSTSGGFRHNERFCAHVSDDRRRFVYCDWYENR